MKLINELLLFLLDVDEVCVAVGVGGVGMCMSYGVCRG